jgi:hypothetical protein
MRNGMTRPVLLIALVVLSVFLVGCGGSHKATGVFAVKKGMTRQQVRKLAGPNYRGSGRNCWLYPASKKGMAIDGIRFCFSEATVSEIQTAVHG